MNKPSHEYCKDCKDWNGSIVNCMEICSIPINIIEEWEKYHAIGTPEECRAAVEKQKAKKPPVVNRPSIFVKVPVCPNCSTQEHYQQLYGKTKYCSNCGQKLDWSDEE